MTWDYYAFGNAFLIFDILSGVRGIIDEASYTTLILIICLVSYFAVVTAKAFSNKFSDIAIYFLIVGLGMSLIFGSTHNIRIIDRLAFQPAQVVTDVPIGITIPLIAANKVGWQITEWYETHMASSLPPGLLLSNGANFSSGSSLLQDMQSFRIADSALNFALGSYLRDCLVPEFYRDPSKYSQIFESTDLWAAIASSSSLRFTSTTPGTTVTCEDAYSFLDNNYFQGFQASTKLFSDYPSLFTTTGSNSAIMGGIGSVLNNSSVLTAIASQFGGGGITSSGFLIGNMLAPEISKSVQDVAVLTGANEVITSLNIGQAKRAQTTGWMTSSILFRDMAGYLFSALNIFVIGLVPIMVLGLFIPKFGTKIVVMYLKVLVWLSLWWPGLALVNHISQGYMFETIRVSGGSGGWWSNGGAPWSLSNAPIITDYAANASMAAGFLATIVPMVMWSIISASGQAFASALQGASGRAEAQGAAKAISSGSYSEGQVSFNTIGGNKNDVSYSQISGDAGRREMLGAGSNTRVEQFDGSNQMVGMTDSTKQMRVERGLNQEQSAALQKEFVKGFERSIGSDISALKTSVEADMRDFSSQISLGSTEGIAQANARVESAASKITAIASAEFASGKYESYDDALKANVRAQLDIDSLFKSKENGDTNASSKLDSLFKNGKDEEKGFGTKLLEAFDLTLGAGGELQIKTGDEIRQGTKAGSGTDDSAMRSEQDSITASEKLERAAKAADTASRKLTMSEEDREALSRIAKAASTAKDGMSTVDKIAKTDTVVETQNLNMNESSTVPSDALQAAKLHQQQLNQNLDERDLAVRAGVEALQIATQNNLNSSTLKPTGQQALEEVVAGKGRDGKIASNVNDRIETLNPETGSAAARAVFTEIQANESNLLSGAPMKSLILGEGDDAVIFKPLGAYDKESLGVDSDGIRIGGVAYQAETADGQQLGFVSFSQMKDGSEVRIMGLAGEDFEQNKRVFQDANSPGDSSWDVFMNSAGATVSSTIHSLTGGMFGEADHLKGGAGEGADRVPSNPSDIQGSGWTQRDGTAPFTYGAIDRAGNFEMRYSDIHIEHDLSITNFKIGNKDSNWEYANGAPKG